MKGGIIVDGFVRRRDAFVLLVDVQERLHAAMSPSFRDSYLKNCVILVESARRVGLPVVVTEQYPKGLGPTIGALADRLEGIPRMEKLAFSCMREQSVRDHILSLGRRTALIAGIEAHVCVMQTALDMAGEAILPVVASDAVCSRRERDMETALNAMGRQGVLVYPTETIVFMLLERAATQEFRAIAPLFR